MKSIEVIEIGTLVKIPSMTTIGTIQEITLSKFNGEMYPIYSVELKVLGRIIVTRFRDFELEEQPNEIN